MNLVTWKNAIGKYAFLIVIPALIFFAGISYYQYLKPIYAGLHGLDQDPAYVYLMSGLSILLGYVPHHVDHPGTTLQYLIAGVIQVRSWMEFPASSDLTSFVLGYAESLIEDASYLLLFLNALSALYVGIRFYRVTNCLFLALITQLTALIYEPILERTVYLAPEALLMTLSNVLIGLYAGVLMNPERRGPSFWVPVLGGLISALGMATKITFLPMVLLLLLSKGLRERMVGVGSFVLFLGFMLSLISERLLQMTAWMSGVVTHSGIYGEGTPEVIDFSALPERFLHLMTAYPLFYSVLIAMGGLLILEGNKAWGFYSRDSAGESPLAISPEIPEGKKHRLMVIAVLVAIMGIQTVMVLKHFGLHYMTPSLGLGLIGLAIVLHRACLKMSASMVMGLGYGVVVCLGIYGGILVLREFNILRDERASLYAGLQNIQDGIKKANSPFVVGAYRCSLPPCAIAFGLGYAPEINPGHHVLLQDFAMYNIWTQQFFLPGQGVADMGFIPYLLKSKREVLLVSPPLDLLKVFDKELLMETKAQSLYRITGAR